ncbi:MAG: hypothetical protein CMJ49_07880, partial [Planctomycetaceae bacterium]|nr:hypothetical protein [Planctomycetaceae bacterium]
WPAVVAARDTWLKAIEDARADQNIDNPLDTGLTVTAFSDTASNFDTDDLADLCGVSRFDFTDAPDTLEVHDLRAEPRCQRSWKRDRTVAERANGDTLSDRDADAIDID